MHKHIPISSVGILEKYAEDARIELADDTGFHIMIEDTRYIVKRGSE